MGPIRNEGRPFGVWADVSNNLGPNEILHILNNINQARSLQYERVAEKHWVVMSFSGVHWRLWRGTEGPGGFTESAEYFTYELAMTAFAREMWRFHIVAKQEAKHGCEAGPDGGAGLQGRALADHR